MFIADAVIVSFALLTILKQLAPLQTHENADWETKNGQKK